MKWIRTKENPPDIWTNILAYRPEMAKKDRYCVCNSNFYKYEWYMYLPDADDVRWIDVRIGLPQKHQPVLVLYKEEFKHVRMRHEVTWVGNHGKLCCSEYNNDIIKWMPLPEPPQEDKE